MSDLEDTDDLPPGFDGQDQDKDPELEHDVPAPAGSPPQPAVQAQDLMSEALDSVGPGATALAKIATRYGLKEDDPAWLIALAVRDATAAGVVADRAAALIESSTRGVSDQIYKATVSATHEVSEVLKKDGVEIGQALVAAIKVTSASVRKELQAGALAAKPEILKDWKSALGQASRDDRSKRKAVAWSTAFVVCGLMLFTVLGAGVAIGRWAAHSPPRAPDGITNFKGVTEYSWARKVAAITNYCPAGRVCVVFKNKRPFWSKL